MLVSQMYMFASMAFSWKWFPHGWWVNIFWLSTVAIGVFLVVRMVQRRPVSLLWLVALVMQAAMAYMWMPTWAPALTWFLVVYFSLETVAWLVGLLDDSTPSMGFGPGSHAESLPDRTPRGVAPADGTSGSVVDVLERTQRMPAFVSLAHGTFSSRLSMAVMAASMAYMFAAMQLMRSAMM
ncbi:MAG: hypothetical protein ACJ715_10615 [Ornithinibacter sp.]